MTVSCDSFPDVQCVLQLTDIAAARMGHDSALRITLPSISSLVGQNLELFYI